MLLAVAWAGVDLPFTMSSSQLLPRIATGLVLGVLAVVAIIRAPLVPFSIGCALVMLLALYEWLKLCGCALSRFFQAALLFVGMATVYVLWDAFQPLAVLLLASALWLYKALMLTRPAKPTGYGCVFDALLSLFAAWVAMLTLKGHPGHGANILLLGLLIVWSADTFAYFGGKKWGRHRLAPALSPGKTWEGVAAGAAGATGVAVLYSLVFMPDIRTPAGLLSVVAVAILVSLISVLGDLSESKLKRAAGAKDSGSLLPGHGGILDRIDGVIVALPAFTLVWWLLAGRGFVS